MIELNCHKSVLSAEGPVDLSFNFSVPSGRCIGVFGDSGVGKTTLIRLLAGLERPDSGRISYRNSNWVNISEKQWTPSQKRKVGLLAQAPNLFPHLTVEENILFASPKGKKDPLLSELLDLIELQSLAKQFSGRLSGGQQKRVALARALASRPEILLLDEPFNGLDRSIKQKIQDYLLSFQKKYHLSTFVVSHTVSDLYKLCDQVIRMDKNQAHQIGTPEQLFGASNLSGSIRQTAELLKIEKSGIVFLITVSIGQQIAKLIAHQEDLEGLAIGDLIQLETKAFSPIIRKMRKS